MSAKEDYIPRPINDFFPFQKNLVSKVVAGAAGWGIAPGKVTDLQDAQAIYVPLYEAINDPTTRTPGAVLAHEEGRKVYEQIIRQFVKENLKSNSSITVQQKKEMNINTGTNERSVRGQITVAPNVTLKGMGNLEILVECRRPEDETRPSMHKDCDVIEFRSKISSIGPAETGGGGPVPIPGDAPPANYAQATDVSTSTKARFVKIIDDPEAVGKWLYVYARYKNNSNVNKSGPWSEVAHVRIS